MSRSLIQMQYILPKKEKEIWKEVRGKLTTKRLQRPIQENEINNENEFNILNVQISGPDDEKVGTTNPKLLPI